MEDPRDEIKRRVDIVELIGEYLTLKPSGTHSHKAICPFHAEKSPSLHVSGDRQIFHCFGCGEGGDCFSFVMKMEGMDFPESLKHLGAKVGVEVKRVSSEVSQRSSRLVETNELAQKFYRKVLVDFPAAASVRDYVAKRGIPDLLAEKFGLGYAPDAWDSLAAVFAKRGFTEHDGIEAGLLMRRKSGQGCIDRFRHRLMIPLRDHHGHTVGFTGRILESPSTVNRLPSTDQGPKYMNSPETPVYHKGRLLFGLDMAKTAVKRSGNIVIVEGNLDVIASHKAGVENVVASSGTALTSDQIDLLKRYTTTLVFSFDQDAAGFEAARKGIALARSKGFDVRAAVLPREAGKDPDEAVQKDPEFWRRATAKTVPIMQFMIERVTNGKDLSNVDEKRKASKLLLPEISAIADAVEREHYLSVLADLLRTDLAVLRASLPKPDAVPPKPAVSSAPNPPQPPRGGKTESAVVILLGIAAGFPKERAWILSRLTPEFFAVGPERELYSQLRQAYDRLQSESPGDETHYFGKLRGDISTAGHSTLLSLLDRAVASAEDWASALPDSLHGELSRLIDTLKKTERDARRGSLLAEIRLAERNGEREAVERLLRDYHELLS